MAYDILIKSGFIYDGTGAKETVGDIGIKDGEISALGNLGNAAAEVLVNAQGKYVTPGFIDMTNHSDTHLSLFKYPALESLLMQGITTVIGGNCGTSLAPLAKKEALGAVRKWADPSEINLNWASMGEYLKELERVRPGVNFGTFIGYGTLRRGIVGDAARAMEPGEIESIKFLIAEAMGEGAFGVSFGLSYGHERVSSTEEILEILGILKGRGLLKIHLRSEGRELLASVNEAIQIGRETGLSLQISHFKAVGKNAWSAFPHALELVNNARSSGLDINFDISPYAATGSPLYLLVPAWAREGGLNDLMQHLGDAEDRKKISAQVEALSLHYDRIRIISAKTDTVIGKTLAEIAEHSGLAPVEALLETIQANEGRVVTVGHLVSPKNILLGVRDPYAVIASDGNGLSQESSRAGNLVHPRSFGAFPHFWHRYVKDLKIVSPEVAVKKMTSLPAEKLRLERRGALRRGNFADVTVFDPNLFRDRATYDNPFRYPSGIEWVVVNGKVAVEQGRPLGTRAGMILKKS